jgi:SulP family sulfate permease
MAPKFSILLDAFFLLIIPQLPLTLGNAMFAASDACHSMWGKQAERVNPTRFGLSIGVGNSVIGLLGGFPMCHGAGGIAAHKQFGGKTGGTTIIIGIALIVFAVISPLSAILLLIPVPLLAAMLLFDSWRMIALIKKLDLNFEIVVAILVGLISFITKNISIALICGLVVEQSYIYIKRRKNLQVEN